MAVISLSFRSVFVFALSHQLALTSPLPVLLWVSWNVHCASPRFSIASAVAFFSASKFKSVIFFASHYWWAKMCCLWQLVLAWRETTDSNTWDERQTAEGRTYGCSKERKKVLNWVSWASLGFLFAIKPFLSVCSLCSIINIESSHCDVLSVWINNNSSVNPSDTLAVFCCILKRLSSVQLCSEKKHYRDISLRAAIK